MRQGDLHKRGKRQQAARRGFALIATMVAIIILSLIGGSLLQLRTSLSSAQKDDDQRVKLEIAVQAAMNVAFLGLTDTRAEKRWRVDGVPTTVVFNDIAVTLVVQDEGGKIDLNAAPREVLVSLFQSAGLDNDTAAVMADRLLDWRESNNLAHLNGLTDEDYHARGSKFRPRHNPFQSVDELKMMIDMTSELFEKIRPALTVYSQSQQINKQTAPREALLTLPGMNEGMVDAIINDRLRGAEDFEDRSLFVRPGVMNPLLPLGGRSFTIAATGKSGSNQVTHEEVIKITDDTNHPFLVLMRK